MLSALEKKRLTWLRRQKEIAEGKYKRFLETNSSQKFLNTTKQIEFDIAGLNADIQALEAKDEEAKEVHIEDVNAGSESTLGLR